MLLYSLFLMCHFQLGIIHQLVALSYVFGSPLTLMRKINCDNIFNCTYRLQDYRNSCKRKET